MTDLNPNPTPSPDTAVASRERGENEGLDWAAQLADSALRPRYGVTHAMRDAVAAELRRIEATGYTRGYEAASEAAPALAAPVQEGSSGATPLGSGWSSSTEPKVSALSGDHPSRGLADVTLADCPVGLFWSNSGELCVKTEYGDNSGRIDAFIVSSGEYFCGDPPQTIMSQRRSLVTPIDWQFASKALSLGLAAASPSEEWRTDFQAAEARKGDILAGAYSSQGAWRQAVVGYAGQIFLDWPFGESPTHWLPLSDPPPRVSDEQSKTEDCDSGLSPKDASVVGEAEAPTPDPVTAARAVLEKHLPVLERLRSASAYMCRAFTGVRDDEAARYQAEVDAIEAALSTLKSHQEDAVLREPGNGEGQS